jgi:hypothetical protein
MMVVHGNSNEPGFAFAFQPFYGLSPIIVLDPIGIPHVKLKQVNPIRPQISQALVGTLLHVAEGEDISQRNAWTGRPKHVLGRNFRGYINGILPRFEDSPNQLFAVACAVDQSRIDEVDS